MKIKKSYILFSIIFLLITLFFFLSYPNKIFFFLSYPNKIKIQKGVIKTFEFLTFKEQKYKKFQNKLDQNLLVSKFGKLEFNTIKLNKRDFEKPLGYLSVIEKNIIYLSGNGDLLLIDKNFSKKKIKTNIKSYFNNEIKEDKLFTPFFINPVRDLLYHDEFLYVVFFNVKIINNKVSFSSSVLRGKYNINYINFKYFFEPNNFINETDYTPPIDPAHAGGRIVVDNNNDFFISVPDYGWGKEAQNLNSIFGKVLKIKSLKDFKIISIGHRNPQGFFYDKEKNIFIESEHGPTGGDEINLIKLNKNYGWPIVSSGRGIEDITIYHNHKKHGYYPPIYTWPAWNPGISQIIKIKKNSKFNFRGLYMVASLSGHLPFYGHHLYLFDIDKNKAILKDKIFVGDRVRDLVYDEINDRIILSLENQEAIGIINIKQQ